MNFTGDAHLVLDPKIQISSLEEELQGSVIQACLCLRCHLVLNGDMEVTPRFSSVECGLKGGTEHFFTLL